VVEEFEGVKKTSYGYQVNEQRVYKHNPQWAHTMDRVVSFEKKYPDKAKFEQHMTTRLKRIKNMEKVYYTIAVLIERGHTDVAEIYDSRLVLEALTEDLDFLDEF